ncbi:acetyl-CoA carboxylase biotin carboxylase subunit family protein [Streptomyces hygroscopicus]|uniref:ATP-grasp domain-containing protein n=1 Tax=Streptomyces hygroscopicus TaxID=1912 RepID=UPI003818966F
MSHLVFVETSGSGVNAIDYAKQAGHTVTYLYSPRYDFTASPHQRRLARKLADRTAEMHDVRTPEDLLATLRAAGTRPGEVDAVLSTLAFCIPLAASLADLIGVRGTPPEGVATARDKGRCRRALDRAGLPSLAFSVVGSEDEALAAAGRIGYPVIVKPVLGVGKGATTIAHEPAHVRAHFAGLAGNLDYLPAGMSAHFDERFIVEELAIGDLYSVEVASDGRSFVPLVSTIQKTGLHNPVLELGCTVPSGLDGAAERELGTYATQVCRTLGLTLGIFHVEMIRTARGFRLTEANPRMAGGALPETVNAVADQDMFAILIDLFLGQGAPLAPLRLNAAVSHSLLAAAETTTVRGDLAPGWFDPFLDRLHSGWVRLEPGSRVNVMRGNFDRFGMIRAVDADPVRAEESCAAVKADIERCLGIPLVPEAGHRSPWPSGPVRSA